MKLLLLFLALFTSTILLSQVEPEEPCPEDPKEEDISGSGEIFASSTASSSNLALNAIDGNQITISRTRLEENPYIQINFDTGYLIPYIVLHSPSIPPNFYIFLTSYPIKESDGLNDLLGNPFITSNQVLNFTSGDTILLNGSGKYLRIQTNQIHQLEVSEMRIPGDPIGEEICDNGIDDNCDEAIDCDDNQCAANLFNASSINTSCPICNDGEIHVQAFGDNLEFSIDGGNTWSSLCIEGNQSMCYWTGLPVGLYTVMVRNSVSGCTETWPEIIEITSPPPGTDGPCENGGFEHGDFENWTGAVGDHDIPGTITWTNNNIALNTQHWVRNTLTHDDKFLGIIGATYPGLGSFYAQLGDDKHGGIAAMLNYCFTVDSNDPYLRFVYAVLLHYNALHDDLVQSFFQWTVYENDGQPIGPNNIIGQPFKVVADINNPYFHRTGPQNDIVYKGWTCEEIDLSDYIGQEICIQFVTSDCQEEAHFGYAYIDGLCETREDLAPTIQIADPPKFCLGEPMPIVVTGNGYNRYTWRISKIDEQGIECCVETFEEIGEDASILDLTAYYNNSSSILGCGLVKIIVTAYNDCGGIAIDEQEVMIICEDYGVDYCNFIPICDYNSNQQILGNIDCEGCTYTWTPAQYLDFVNGDQSQPWIELVQFPYAAEETYHVVVESPYGCETHEEDIKIVDLSLTEMEFEKNVTHCSYEVIVTVDLKFEIPNEFVSVKLEESIANEFFDMTLDQSASTGSIKVFKFTMKRAANTFLYAQATIDLSFFGDCSTESFCEYDLTIGLEPKSGYLGPWKIWIPNVFSPNGDGANDIWAPVPSGHSLACNAGDDFSFIYNNIYGMKVTIRDRWANVHYEKELFRGVYDTEGILSSDFEWDGTGINGLPVQSGVYVVTLELWSCYGTAGYNNCFINCPCMPGGPWPCNAWCNDSNHEVFTIDLTVVL